MFDLEKEHSFTDDDYFDDCAVCLAQKNADNEGREITNEELIEAIKKAKEHGAIVGGSIN